MFVDVVFIEVLFRKDKRRKGNMFELSFFACVYFDGWLWFGFHYREDLQSVSVGKLKRIGFADAESKTLNLFTNGTW